MMEETRCIRCSLAVLLTSEVAPALALVGLKLSLGLSRILAQPGLLL
jgi:hypothetical protein